VSQMRGGPSQDGEKRSGTCLRSRRCSPQTPDVGGRPLNREEPKKKRSRRQRTGKTGWYSKLRAHGSNRVKQGVRGAARPKKNVSHAMGGELRRTVLSFRVGKEANCLGAGDQGAAQKAVGGLPNEGSAARVLRKGRRGECENCVSVSETLSPHCGANCSLAFKRST